MQKQLALSLAVLCLAVAENLSAQQRVPRGFETDSDVASRPTGIDERRANVDAIFTRRTVDGNLQLAIHKNQWTRESLDQVTGTNADRVGLKSAEYQGLVLNGMGLAFLMTTVSDRETEDGSRRGLVALESARDRYTEEPGTALIQQSLQIDPAYHNGKVGVLLYSQFHFELGGRPEAVIDQQRAGLSVFQLCYSTTTRGLNRSPLERLGAGSYDDLVGLFDRSFHLNLRIEDPACTSQELGSSDPE